MGSPPVAYKLDLPFQIFVCFIEAPKNINQTVVKRDDVFKVHNYLSMAYGCAKFLMFRYIVTKGYLLPPQLFTELSASGDSSQSRNLLGHQFHSFSCKLAQLDNPHYNDFNDPWCSPLSPFVMCQEADNTSKLHLIRYPAGKLLTSYWSQAGK